MKEQVVVAGGGIGGLAAALALGRAGARVQLLEQADALGEVGAGLQLGPNAVKVLSDWGLSEALRAVASFPEALVVRDAHSAVMLGGLRLGEAMKTRHGHPYATLRRADLQTLLLDAVRSQPDVSLALGQRVSAFEAHAEQVRVLNCAGQPMDGVALIGCDGLWSRVRAGLLGEQPVRATGHLAYRGMVAARDWPHAQGQQAPVAAWLGPRLHVVHYPVRGGQYLNVVAVVHGVLSEKNADAQSWSHPAHAADLMRTVNATSSVCSELRDALAAVQNWTLWPLHDRPPMAGAHEHARGRVALLGDAAHPMRPYLAQGAAMALEDAWTLGRLLQSAPDSTHVDWPQLLQRYAHTRWARNAKVQQRAARNGTVFHATGPLRWARNAAMAVLREGLLGNRWLYSGPPEPLT